MGMDEIIPNTKYFNLKSKSKIVILPPSGASSTIGSRGSSTSMKWLSCWSSLFTLNSDSDTTASMIELAGCAAVTDGPAPK